MTEDNAYILRKLAYEISLRDGDVKYGMEIAYDIIHELMDAPT